MIDTDKIYRLCLALSPFDGLKIEEDTITVTNRHKIEPPALGATLARARPGDLVSVDRGANGQYLVEISRKLPMAPPGDAPE